MNRHLRQLISPFAACAFYWAAFPPIGAWPCAWIAPVFWLQCTRQVTIQLELGTPIWSSLWKICVAGTSCWLALLSWMAWPFSWLTAAWIAISVIMGGLWATAIGLAAVVGSRFHWSLPFSLAVTWCGTEWLRSDILVSGFPLAALEHSQFRVVLLIQCADVLGQQGFGFLLVLTGACASEAAWHATQRAGTPHTTAARGSLRIRRYACLSVGLLGAMSGYGMFRLGFSDDAATAKPNRRIAVLQSATPWNVVQDSDSRAFRACRELAMNHGYQADLVVWPEGPSELEWSVYERDFVPDGWQTLSSETVATAVREAQLNADSPLIELAGEAQAPILLNVTVNHFRTRGESLPERTNSLVLVDPKRGILHRYDKNQLTPIVECDLGQRVISRDVFSRSRYVAGQGGGIFAIPRSRNDPEQAGEVNEFDNLYAAANICFDSLFSEVIRRQLAKAREMGHAVDVIVSSSNDLDSKHRVFLEMRLASHVFRAVENRTACVVASNCGISAAIDCYGRITAEGRPGTIQCLETTVFRCNEWGLYQVLGEVIPQMCGMFTWLVIPAILLWQRRPGWN